MDKAVILYDATIPPIVFAADKLGDAIGKNGTVVDKKPMSSLNQVTERFCIVLTTIQSNEVSQAIAQFEFEPIPALAAQGYAIRNDRSHGRTICWVIGADASGTMYGALDIVDAINTGARIEHLSNKSKAPFIANRGIKFNIPLDARTPSYSDNGDAAQQNIAEMWSMDFWKEFLDDMAFHRYNTLSLWNLHPFPSMVHVPEYPDIALEDVKRTTSRIRANLEGTLMSTAVTLDHLETLIKMTIQEKILFWKEVMQYAKNRGIDIYIITWNIFTYGTEGNHYGINDEQDNETTIDYFRASVRCLLETYPLLSGIGVTAGEHMSHMESPYSNEEWLWRSYGEGIMDVKKKDPNRIIRFIHRAHQTSFGSIEEAFKDYSDTFDYSYKYSLAHMYSSVHPPFIYRSESYSELPGGYLIELPRGKKTWLSVRDDDFYYLRWGSSEFVRQYILNMPPSDKLAGFYMGPDGIIWGRESVSTDPDTPRQSMIRKRWYGFLLWGQLSYDPTISDMQFEKLLGHRFPEVSSHTLFEAWTTSSKILPLVTTFHWEGNHFDFQWYPEACYSHPVRAKGFHTVEHFINDTPMPDSGMIGVIQYCDGLLSNTVIPGITPLRVAQDLTDYSERTLQLIADLHDVTDKELRHTLSDIEAVSILGKYYASKILGAVELCLYRKSDRADHQRLAIEHLESASAYWREYASRMASMYLPQYFTRLGHEQVNIQLLQEHVDEDVVLAR